MIQEKISLSHPSGWKFSRVYVRRNIIAYQAIFFSHLQGIYDAFVLTLNSKNCRNEKNLNQNTCEMTSSPCILSSTKGIYVLWAFLACFAEKGKFLSHDAPRCLKCTLKGASTADLCYLLPPLFACNWCVYIHINIAWHRMSIVCRMKAIKHSNKPNFQSYFYTFSSCFSYAITISFFLTSDIVSMIKFMSCISSSRSMYRMWGIVLSPCSTHVEKNSPISSRFWCCHIKRNFL